MIQCAQHIHQQSTYVINDIAITLSVTLDNVALMDVAKISYEGHSNQHSTLLLITTHSIICIGSHSNQLCTSILTPH